MKKTVLILAFLMPCLINAQIVKGWRIQPNFFMVNAIVDSNLNATTIKGKSTTFVPKFSYGLECQAVFGVSSKIDFITGLGFDARNFTTNTIGLSWGSDFDPKTGNVRQSTTVVETKNLISLFIPLKIAYNFNQNNAFEVGFNTYYRIIGKSDVFSEYTDGSPRLSIDNPTQRFRLFNVNAQIGYCFKKKFSETLILLIKPYADVFILTDEFNLNNGSNRFWDAGLSIGLEFGNTIEKIEPKRKKRRGQ